MKGTSGSSTSFQNPFRPGAGHMPPYLAGRETERKEFARLLEQESILQNLVLTGLRGIGKSVLLETLKPMAINAGWLWAGTDLSESVSVSEETLAVRLLTDLAVVTSSVKMIQQNPPAFLASKGQTTETTVDYKALRSLYDGTPGLTADKIKAVLEFVWGLVPQLGKKGIIFAYDEAQNLSDRAPDNQYPLSLLLDIFQSIQRKDIPFMLVLVGLPTLFPRLVSARTFSERMFRVVTLGPLDEPDTIKAVQKPIEDRKCAVRFGTEAVKMIYQTSGGYPYFIQYICREAFDIWVQNSAAGQPPMGIPVDSLIRKLDTDFFMGRWSRATDRQHDLLCIIATLPSADEEFTVQEIAEKSARSKKPFSPSHINQMLASLSDAGLIYKNRHGKYSFAVPLMGQFIKRHSRRIDDQATLFDMNP
jgi:hypothetical protein